MRDDYKTILIAIAMEGGGKQVLERASHIYKHSVTSGNDKIRVIVLNVGYLPIPTYAGMYGEGLYAPKDFTIDFNFVRKQALSELTNLIEGIDLPIDNILVEFGRSVDTILNIAEKECVDLIVMGSHARHGIGLLLGSTANGVLHRAKCDILAVRITE